MTDRGAGTVGGVRVHSERDGDGVVVRVDGARTDGARIHPAGTVGVQPPAPDADAGDDAVPVPGSEVTELLADGDLALITALLPAMRAGSPLRIDQPVSAGLLATSRRIQDVFCTWDRFLRPTDRWYSPVPVDAPARTNPTGRADATACLFTGGVDSFHTAVTERDRIDALVYVHGFDVALDDVGLRAVVGANLRAAAHGLGLPLVEVGTDLQAFGDRHAVGWNDYHGAALAAVGTALARRFGRLLVPATHTYAHLEGLGSHPLLDPWWSGERLAVEHVGADATRVDKLRVLTASEPARRHLRVCWENRDGRYNCGMCEKCVRTGVAVRLAGAEGLFPTVPSPSLRRIASALPTGRGSAWHELWNEAVAAGVTPRLRWAIEAALTRHGLRRRRSTGRWVP